MSKKNSIKKYAFTVLVTVIGILLTVCSFTIPFTCTNFNGFANSIKMGLDLKGGVVVVYDAIQLDEGDLSEQIEATIDRLTDLLNSKGYTETSITQQGSSQVRIEVADVEDTETLLEMIETPDLLEIKSVNDIEAEAELDGRNIEDVEYSYDSDKSAHGVSITFDSEGTAIFTTLTTNAYNATDEDDKKLYIFLGNTLISSPTVEAIISSGSTFISGSWSTQSEAEAFKLKLLSGTYPVQLLISSSNIIPPTLGEGAITGALIAGIVTLAILFAFLIFRYRIIGLIGCFVLVIYTLLLIFFLQSVPLVQLTLPGVAGIILSIGMAVDGLVIIFERIKEEYASGKNISTSFRVGFKKSIAAILDANITTVIAALVLSVFGTGSVQGFAVVLLIGVVISLFTSLVVARGLLKNYLPLNSTNAKILNLKREEGTNEL